MSVSFGLFVGKLAKLNELVEEVVRTTVDTGPKGALRLAQGFEAVITVGGEWLLQQSQLLPVCTEFPTVWALSSLFCS